ncbi:uncharacterized mitochondrial protein AtMg00810-like [Aristolochia californica]|uniref:uncharacterized mitochondrial protein AtMg00810-like n=1 Tax=Aristolochia californica TaxID=171875 RepID=UPI0035D701DF
MANISTGCQKRLSQWRYERRNLYARITWICGFYRCSVDHSVFIENTTRGKVILAVYVDDIILSGSDFEGIQKRKRKNIHGIILSQRKYALDLLEETGMLGRKPVDTSMDANTKLCGGTGEDVDIGKYQMLVGRLIFLCLTRPDISFAVSVVS